MAFWNLLTVLPFTYEKTFSILNHRGANRNKTLFIQTMPWNFFTSLHELPPVHATKISAESKNIFVQKTFAATFPMESDFFIQNIPVAFFFWGVGRVFFPSEARPKAEPVDRVTRSGIRTTKMKKKFWRPPLSTTTTTKSDTFFTAEFSHFLIANFFSRKWSPKFFSIFLH